MCVVIITVWTNKEQQHLFACVHTHADTPFKQQKLKAWQPILTPNWVIGSFALVGLIFIPIGIILHTESDNVRPLCCRYNHMYIYNKHLLTHLFVDTNT